MSSRLIYQSLCESPLLMGDVAGGEAFDRTGIFASSAEGHELNEEQKLGHLYEDGLAQLLEKSARYELLEKGVQLQSDRHHTLGELDFLLQDGDNVIHLELAVKFYLAVASEDGGHLLPGPDARDNYGKKLDRLRDHQLTLTARYKQHLPALYRDKEITPQYLIIGCLFDHIEAAEKANPEGVHPEARRGAWLHQSDVARCIPVGRKLEVIPKPLWPVPLPMLNDLSLGPPLNTGIALTRCVMVRVEGMDYPVFIAPDGYPVTDR